MPKYKFTNDTQVVNFHEDLMKKNEAKMEENKRDHMREMKQKGKYYSGILKKDMSMKHIDSGYIAFNMTQDKYDKIFKKGKYAEGVNNEC